MRRYLYAGAVTGFLLHEGRPVAGVDPDYK
jgi:hypothetical protein